MRKSGVRVALLVIGGFALLAISFCVGGVYAARRVCYEGNAGALVPLTGVLEALATQDIEKARKIAAVAVDRHVQVLHNMESASVTEMLCAMPWMPRLDTSAALQWLPRAHSYFKEHPEQLSPETNQFLAQHTAIQKPEFPVETVSPEEFKSTASRTRMKGVK